mgnify:CR=1 FL=1
MENNTVNKKNIKGVAAGQNDAIKVAAIAIYKETPHELAKVTESGEKKSIPFIIEDGKIVNNGEYIAIRAKDTTREEFEAMKVKTEKAKSGEDR